MARVPLIVVGGGSIGQRHIAVCNAHPDVELVGVIEADIAQRNRLVQMGLPVFDSLVSAPQASALLL